MSNEWFQGKSAVVTGAGHGIGLGIAEALAKAGARVCGVEIDKSRCDRLGDLDITPIHADISDGSAVADQIIEHFSEAPRIIVNNVGTMDGRSFLEMPTGAVEKTWRANVFGPWDFSRHFALKLIEENASASILFILSLHTWAIRLCPDYSTSKAAIHMLLREMADSLGPHGIRVNGISPGIVDTWHDYSPDSPEQRAKVNAMIPLRRVGEVSDVIPLSLALLNNDISGYVTGANIALDGGLSQFNWLHHVYGNAEQERLRFEIGDTYIPSEN